jgi:choline-sulfatase
MRRPNLLLLMADQLTVAALANYGNAVVKAPNLTALGERGVTFDNAYCNFPICAPSRYSMLTGRLPHSIDAFDNASEMPACQPTLMHYLQRLGYQTTLSGKMHFVGPDQLHGYRERLNTDIYPADFAWVPDWKAGPRNAPTGISMRAVAEAGWCERSLQLDYDEETVFHAKQKLYDFARFQRDTPFFLTVSMSHPHSPYTASKEHWDRYDHDEIDMPRTGPIPFDKLDAHSRWLYLSHGRDRMTITPEHVRNARHAYYGMVSYVDDKIGEILDTLDRMGLANDTIVVFTSDHGEMLGERGMWFKQTFFEGAARVPLIVAGPNVPAERRIKSNVSLVDLMPTLLTLAGAEAADTRLDGHDLTPLFEDETSAHDEVIAEYSDMGVCAPCRMIRSGDYKYVYVHGEPPMLFDLARDRDERHNLAGDPSYHEIETHLRDRLLADWNPEAINRRILASQADRQLIWSVMRSQPARDNWSIEIRKGDKSRYVRGGGDAEGTVATKGRARLPYVLPVAESAPQSVEALTAAACGKVEETGR